MSVPIFTLFVSIETEMNEYSTGYLLIDIITVSHCTSQNVTSDGYILELNMLSFEGKKFWSETCGNVRDFLTEDWFIMISQ